MILNFGIYKGHSIEEVYLIGDYSYINWLHTCTKLKVSDAIMNKVRDKLSLSN